MQPHVQSVFPDLSASMSPNHSREGGSNVLIKIFENPMKSSEVKMIIGTSENLTVKDEQL